MKGNTYHDFLAYMGISSAHPGGMALTKQMLAKLGLKADHHVLDAGCGTGQTAAYIAETFGCQVTAVDTHPVMIEKAKQRFNEQGVQIHVLQGNIEQLPLKSEAYDLIIAESVIVFTKIEATLFEFFRLLKPGGVILNLEMTTKPPINQSMVNQFKQVYGIKQLPQESTWLEYYRKTNFDNIEVLKRVQVADQIATDYATGAKQIDLNISESMDHSLYQIGHKHQLLTEKYRHQLNYHIYRAQKPEAP
ncbi:class I SAM-dependent methyltransferase [Aquibacillus sediminis]|uniref:class I SAM-dependent methyltransferase n=1 Tax=Aquibacillus sediminis TaxID=2574734 RepID=UPI0011087A92|nr:class I SAM-dependent methyltransferase [Aquibacillus sediminis]